MSRQLLPSWSRRHGRKAIRELLRIGTCPQVDAQVRVDALSIVTSVCGEDVEKDVEKPEPVRAIGFKTESQGEE